MRKAAWFLGVLVLASFMVGCSDGVSQAQADDRAKQMEEAKKRPEEQGSQQ